ncbi:acetyl-CoA C-acetyltransferase/acetyl-CoA acyltransferase [Litorivivens lipolytica]|uniref:Acetyl-CoA C-acetyltransferase/acetyl-CoA acyltransferase n=1 Tax=Litorivivens lipolytica TaxID=1524264 RepID=A0A7W4Z5D0_9GAMM|nr:acetyl-CoA C-acyltransferase [Litorivivens lipolytica]MBB3047012.1 acetyl-CoA C-acetyltransferase/acetyl-CoA acyltransferase [Litorivivens lipolytica]
MDAYILGCLRTPRTKARENGSLTALSPAELVAGLTREFKQPLESTGALMLGCVGQVGAQGGNLALQSKLHARLPEHCTAMTLNHFCASGLSSIGLAANAVALGQYRQVIAGGVECMSQVPFMADKAHYYQDPSLPVDERYIPVALSADILATKEGVSCEELNAATLRSHQRAAQSEPYQASLKPVRDNGRVLAERDECIRAETTLESLSAMPPGFEAMAKPFAEILQERRIEYRHSIANAPPMVDGAALGLIAGVAHKSQARARILGWLDSAASAADSLTGGMAAMEALLQQQGLTLKDIDRIEFMEAFAVAPVLFERRYGVDPEKVNVSGGHLAKGHPMGATGAVLLSTLCDVLEQDGGTLGLVVATGAGGVGSAMLVERMQ